MKRFVVLLFPFWITLLFLLLYPLLRINWGFVLANKGLGLSLRDDVRREYWYKAARICLNSGEEPVAELTNDEAIIRQLDDCYMNRIVPLIVISDTVTLPPAAFALGGLSRSNQISQGTAFLYGNGYLEAMIVSLEREDMILSIRAFHHELPPVILEVWIDEEQIGELYYDKGDNSWETLSLPINVDANFHKLRISYVNDSYDIENGIDRNAYIREIKISQ